MYRDKDNLKRLYLIENKTQDEIAELYGVHRKTISRWINKYGLNKTRKEITKAFNDKHFKEYGVKTPAERKDVAKKMTETNIIRYGNPSSLHGLNQEKTNEAIIQSIGAINPSYLRLNEEAQKVLLNKEAFKTFLESEQNTSSRIISSKLNISMTIFNRYVKRYNLEGLVDRQMSRGSSLIEDFLKSNSFSYEKEKTFIDCRGDKNPLPFDFFIPSKNLLIEFDGRQHFEIIDYWGGQDGFNKRQRYDNLKNKYAKENNIKLLRFNHLQSDEEIIDILKKI